MARSASGGASNERAVLNVMQTMFCTPRLAISGCIAALLVSVSAFAQTSPTGNWTGTYTYSIQVSGCSNKTFTSNGNVAATLLQTGSSLSGRIDLTNLLVFSGNCNPVSQEITGAIVGSISGSTIGWRFPNDGSETQFGGTTDENSISAQISDAFGGTGTLTMTRTPGDAPAVNLTGTWSGNYSFTDRCSNGATQSYTGTFTLGMTQSGSNAGGVVTMLNVPLYDQTCKKITTLNMAMSAAGSVSGTKFTGSVFDPSGSFDFPIQATIASAAMNGSVQGASLTSTTGTFTLNQSSSTAPASDFAGNYDGSYSEADNDSLFCFNIGTLQYDGAASISIVQAGNNVSGYMAFEDTLDVSSSFGSCVVVNAGEQVFPLYGTLSGNTLTLQLPLGNGVSDLLTVHFNGDSLTGTIIDSYGDQAAFTMTKTSSAAPPAITAFAAAPSSIGFGGSTTLTWSTANATTISIDNGLGSQALSGSLLVSPTQTTTYTLTATSATGSVTAQTTVTVIPAGPRRRSARS
jgi:hypothetical protein